MRVAIRNKLLKEVTELKECYEPNIPNKETEKPYSIVVATDDTDNGEVIGFKRNIEIWLYDKRLSFKNLDNIIPKVIKALDLQVITNPKTQESFTCRFDGIIGQDMVDEEWDAIAKGLKFTIIALHEESEANVDTWLDSLKNFTKKTVNLPIYLNSWTSDFDVPSILWRVQNHSIKRENNSVIKENKTLICHVAGRNKAEIVNIIDVIENSLVNAFKIPYNLEDKRYLTIESISEDREADMLLKGQISVQLFRRKMVDTKQGTLIGKISHTGDLRG